MSQTDTPDDTTDFMDPQPRDFDVRYDQMSSMGKTIHVLTGQAPDDEDARIKSDTAIDLTEVM